jgi:hypothetical protein
MHEIRDEKRKSTNLFCVREGDDLCKTKVLASGGDCCEDLLAEYLVAFIFGKIKLWTIISRCIFVRSNGETYG